MDFFEKTEYTETDLRILIETQAEESTYLDFKAAGALEKTNVKRAEIAKDVSAFANSDGGVIIYGIKEEGHVASGFSFIDGNEYTKSVKKMFPKEIEEKVLTYQYNDKELKKKVRNYYSYIEDKTIYYNVENIYLSLD